MILPRRGNVIEDYHGTRVADPFRWMEDPEAQETKEFIAAHNQVTRAYLDNIRARRQYRERLTELWNYEKLQGIFRSGDRYFFYKNDGLQSQAVLYYSDTLDGEPRLVIDPNRLSDDGTVALSGVSPSHDGKLIAYSCTQSGSDRQLIRIRNVETGEDFPEVIQWCRFTRAAWLPDDSGFYYTRFPEPGQYPPEDSVNYAQVYLHKLGAPQSADQLIYHRPDFKELGFGARVTDDGRYLVLHVSLGTNPENRFYYRELSSRDDFIRLLDDNDAMYRFVGNDGSVFYFHTKLAAPNGRVIAIDVNQPERENWRELIPESSDVLDSVQLINDCFVLTYSHDVHNLVKIHARDGSYLREVELPTLGTCSVSGRREHDEMFVTFTSFLYPATIFRYDFASATLDKFWTANVDFDATQFETKQVFYTSKDGTRVPLFLTHRKGLQLDGNNPTLLYGYGGYNSSQRPNFALHTLPWLEAGGVYAVAGLRGGNEYGETWHRAGMLEQKQNVFDDFIAAAEWLIENQYTRREKLAIYGRSNGGLLTGACMTQRPDLYGAVICQVPVIDMLRFHRFTAGRFWTGEYGNAEVYADHFKFMHAYSPLHNVKFGTIYPPTLIMTAESDDRVVPMHSLKFAATLHWAAGNPDDIYLRVESKAGHGHGKPTGKIIDEYADIFAFLFERLGVK
jgi:prolyl oligopeptidase